MSESSFIPRNVRCWDCKKVIRCDKGYEESLRVDALEDGRVIVSPPDDGVMVQEMEDAFTLKEKLPTGRWVLVCVECADKPHKQDKPKCELCGDTGEATLIETSAYLCSACRKDRTQKIPCPNGCKPKER